MSEERLQPAVGLAALSPEVRLYALGFSRRKRAFLRQCLQPRQVVFIQRIAQLPTVPTNACLLLWGVHTPEGLSPDTRILRVEDGFLRSVGLGADLVRPMSWVVDGRGMYFDARQPSDLEVLLAKAEFSPELLQRAQRLRQRIVAEGVTKYNTGQGQWLRPEGKAQVLLVIGQVQTDASVRYGAPGVCTNMGLLQAVREAHPQAWVVYKPHPDVVAGLRLPGNDEAQATQWCDEVVLNAPVQQMLPQVDAVHVMTSLTGFEALLRGCAVVCHGIPFYAGWGLTQDSLPIERRARSLSLDALVAGALILYPYYFAKAEKASFSVEQALDALLQAKQQKIPFYIRWWRAVFRYGLKIWAKHEEHKRIKNG